MLLSEREMWTDKYFTNMSSIHCIFQKFFMRQIKSSGLVYYLLTALGSVFAVVIEYVANLLTMKRKMTQDKEKSLRKTVQQVLTTDYVNVAEVLQVYPLGLVASPKPKRTAQDQNCKCIHAVVMSYHLITEINFTLIMGYIHAWWPVKFDIYILFACSRQK